LRNARRITGVNGSVSTTYSSENAHRAMPHDSQAVTSLSPLLSLRMPIPASEPRCDPPASCEPHPGGRIPCQ
jgi:hypothetical protein